MFDHCTQLTSVTFNGNISDIQAYAFANCTSLTTIKIPSSITNIRGYAFYGCNSMTSVTIEAVTPPTTANSTFSQSNNCTIYVPAESVDAYKAASGWSNFADRIQAIPSNP